MTLTSCIVEEALERSGQIKLNLGLKTCTMFLIINLSCTLCFNYSVMIFESTAAMRMSNEQKYTMYWSIEDTEDTDLLYVNSCSISIKCFVTLPIHLQQLHKKSQHWHIWQTIKPSCGVHLPWHRSRWKSSSDNKYVDSFVHNILIGEKCSCRKSICLHTLVSAG